MRKKIKVLFLGLIVSGNAFSQNTLSYTELESSYNNGVELFEKRAYSSSRKEFSKYVLNSKYSLNPNKFNIANAEYYSALAALYTKSKDAQIEVERFVLNNSEHPKAKLIYSDLAENSFKNGDYPNAIVYFTKALENRLDNTDSYEIRYKLGISYYNLKKYPQALTEFNYIKNTATKSAIHAAYYAAVINFQNENFDEALSDLRRVENVNPYKIETPNWISQILFRQKKYDDLLEYSEPIIANPNGRKIDEICLVTAEVHFFRDNFDRAALYYSKFNDLKRGTVNPQVTFRHGYSLYKINEFQKSIPILKKIAANNDEIGQQAAYYLGISSLKSGDLNSALLAFETAKKSDFDAQIKEEATYNLIKVLIEKNDNTTAINELQNYLKLYPK
jgi:tetratricopeptide (TPR) repeat protein